MENKIFTQRLASKAFKSYTQEEMDMLVPLLINLLVILITF